MHLIKDFNFYSKLLELNESYSSTELRRWKEKIREFCTKQGVDFEEACKALNIPLTDSSGFSDELVKVLDSICSGNWELEDGIINVQGGVTIYDNSESQNYLFKNGKLVPGVVFGTIENEFIVNFPVVSLEGFPTEVKGNFKINSRELESLVGSPRKVGRDFTITHSKIQNLEGCPDFVGRDFELGNNQNLVSLQGSENCDVKSRFEVHNCNLTTLEGGPKVFEGTGYFKCDNNKLKTLIGAPSAGSKGYTIVCDENPELYSLEGLPLDKKCFVQSARKCLMPESVLKDVYNDAVKFNSWTAAYFYLITTQKFQRMSKAQRDPIRNSISPQALQGKSFALSPIWKDPIMQDPAVKRLMKKIQLTDKEVSDTEMMSDFEDLGIY